MKKQYKLKNNEYISYLTNMNHDNERANLILIHGYKSSSEFMNILLNKYFDNGLSNDIKYIIPDLYAHGDSSGDIKKMTLTKQFEGLNEIIESKVNENFNIIGHSLGGALGIIASMHYPNIKVITHSTPHSIFDGFKNYATVNNSVGSINQIQFSDDFLKDLHNYKDAYKNINGNNIFAIIHGTSEYVDMKMALQTLMTYKKIPNIMISPYTPHNKFNVFNIKAGINFLYN